MSDGAEGKLTVLAVIKDADGRKVAESSSPVKTDQGKMQLSIKSPMLWDIASPYLYTLEVSLMQNGRKIDGADCKLGLRTLEFNPDKGFALNGKNMKVKGVCLHHDAGVLGAFYHFKNSH